MNVPRWALGNPTMVVLVTIALSVWGSVSYLTISRREDPEIRISTALVVTIYPGAGAEKVERQVTSKVEQHVEKLDTVEELESTSRENLSVVSVEIDYDSDTDMQWQKLRSLMEDARGELPDEVVGPEVWTGFGDTTAMIVSLAGADPVTLGRIADDLEPELRRIDAVGDVEIHGKRPEVVYLETTQASLARFGFTALQVGKMLEMRNLKIPAGAVTTPEVTFRVEPSGAFESTSDIEDTIIDISPQTGMPVHVRDVFVVRRTIQTPPDNLVLRSGSEAVAVGVIMKPGNNIVAMGGEVREALEKFRPRLPPGVDMQVVHDAPRQVRSQVDAFMENLLEGLILVIAVMALFMGWRPAVISAVAIPLSILGTLALLPLLKVDLEVVSIAGFIVAIGMLVDDAIIVTDNIDIKLRDGLDPREAAWRGSSQLVIPVLVGTAGTVVAFLPMLLLGDEVGGYVRGLPIAVSVSVAFSLVVSLTASPLLASVLMKPTTIRPGSVRKGRMARLYRSFMGVCLRARWLVVAAGIASMAASALLFRIAGFSFFPDANRDQCVVDIWLEEGSAIAQTEKIARSAEAMLIEDPEVKSTLVHVGVGGPRFYITISPQFRKANYAQIMVNTSSPETTPGVIDRFNSRARKDFAGARVFAHKLVMGMPVEAPVAIQVIGPDLERLRHYAEQVQQILREIPGTDQVRDDMGPDVPSIRVEVDEELASRVGVTSTDVALAFLASHQGWEATTMSDGDDEIPIVIRLLPGERGLEDGLASLPVASNATGEKIALGAIARIGPVWGPGVIKHVDSRRAITVLAWTKGRLASEIVDEAMVSIGSMRRDPGYEFAISGEKKEMDKAFRDMLLVFGVIVAALVGMLVAQLGSLRKAFVVLMALPLSIVGASIALVVGGYSFSFTAFLGIISLAGMVTKSAVVWVDFVERAVEQGASVREAVVEAGIYRLRPIMLTAVTTIGGLLPLALFGGVLFEPMSWVMISGLGMATMLTLVVIPVFYTLLVPDRRVPAPPAAPALTGGSPGQ